jgi:septum formation protein
MQASDSNAQVYLASRSPRRRELLEQIGVHYAVLEVGVDETARRDLQPADQARQLACDKARAGWRAAARTLDLPVLGADTLIEFDGEVFGKPRDRDAALAMLARLAGQTHWVHTGIAVCAHQRCESSLSQTRVTLRSSTSAERLAYWYSGEPADKAGAYAIQGLGAVFVESVQGSYSGVVGLPLCETAQLLRRFGIDPFDE